MLHCHHMITLGIFTEYGNTVIGIGLVCLRYRPTAGSLAMLSQLRKVYTSKSLMKWKYNSFNILPSFFAYKNIRRSLQSTTFHNSSAVFNSTNTDSNDHDSCSIPIPVPFDCRPTPIPVSSLPGQFRCPKFNHIAYKENTLFTCFQIMLSRQVFRSQLQSFSTFNLTLIEH